MPYTKKIDLVKVKSPTGKVHYAFLDFVDKKKVKIYQPYCNHRCWIGDYWGKRWVKTDEPVTCGNCLKSIGCENLSLSENLVNLGSEIRQSETALLEKFLKLSKECEFRKVTCYCRSVVGLKRYSFRCTNPGLEDPAFGWSCGPSNCPHIGHLSGSEWAYDIAEKPNEQEIKDYEDSSRVKKD